MRLRKMVMDRKNRKIMRVFLLSTSFLFFLMSCSGAKNSQRNAFKENEYRRLMERQKNSALAAAEEEALKRKSGLTAEEYERLGDSYLRQGSMASAFLQYDKALRLDRN